MHLFCGRAEQGPRLTVLSVWSAEGKRLAVTRSPGREAPFSREAEQDLPVWDSPAQWSLVFPNVAIYQKFRDMVREWESQRSNREVASPPRKVNRSHTWHTGHQPAILKSTALQGREQRGSMGLPAQGPLSTCIWSNVDAFQQANQRLTEYLPAGPGFMAMYQCDRKDLEWLEHLNAKHYMQQQDAGLRPFKPLDPATFARLVDAFELVSARVGLFEVRLRSYLYIQVPSQR